MFADNQVNFLKYNTSAQHHGIIQSEYEGLSLLNKHNISTPQVELYQSFEHHSFLVMEWLESGQSESSDHQLAQTIAHTHSVKSTSYGAVNDNYIGALTQSNTNHQLFSDFYIQCRIIPQIKLAMDSGYGISNHWEKLLYKVLKDLPTEDPCLIHGDLWGGNYILTQTKAYLIDPSVSFLNREMDIAMMRLFGGFSRTVFNTYNEIYPLQNEWTERLKMYQLYYLFVHLNLFGESYLSQVLAILNSYK